MYEQSIARILHERFPDADLSYLLVDAARARLIDARWDDAESPVPMGSLVKPFTALAWREGRSQWPVLECRGKRDRCWYAPGHGRVDVAQAIAGSCNAYFHALAREVRAEDVQAVARRFHIAAPDDHAAETLAGLGDGWRIAPAAVARAYCTLARDEGARELARGMALSAQRGTGRGAGGGLVKTGTAPCLHPRHAPGDGYAIVLDPAVEPRFLLIVREHGTTGAEAAVTAGRMMRVVREGR